jgi:uncharacterized membrane protein
MSTTLVRAAELVAAIGTSLVGGVLFSFSTFTMQGLARLPAPQGMAAMQSINTTAVRPPLMAAMFGTGAVCAALATRGFGWWGEERSPLLVAGSALYLIGVIGVTTVANVPLNNALATVDPDAPTASRFWHSYVRRWTRWNHARTLSSLAAGATFVVAAAANR